MHGQGKVRAYADDDICKDQRAFKAVGDDEYVVIVLDAELDGLNRSHMDVALRHDNAVVDLKLSQRTNQRTAGCPFCIPGLADDPFDAKLPAVRNRDLNLGLLDRKSVV